MEQVALLILEEEVELVVVQQMARLAALALSSFATQILLMTLHQPQAHRHSPPLVDTRFTSGLAPAQLHSEVAHGALCKT
jgi:hypothetical protein